MNLYWKLFSLKPIDNEELLVSIGKLSILKRNKLLVKHTNENIEIKWKTYVFKINSNDELVGFCDNSICYNKLLAFNGENNHLLELGYNKLKELKRLIDRKGLHVNKLKKA